MLKSGVVLFLYHYELVPIPLSLCDLPLFPAVPPYCGFRRLKRKRQNGISQQKRVFKNGMSQKKLGSKNGISHIFFFREMKKL